MSRSVPRARSFLMEAVSYRRRASGHEYGPQRGCPPAALLLGKLGFAASLGLRPACLLFVGLPLRRGGFRLPLRFLLGKLGLATGLGLNPGCLLFVGFLLGRGG